MMDKDRFEILKLKGDIFRGKLKSIFTIILIIAEIVFVLLFIAKYSGYEIKFFTPELNKVAVLKIDKEIVSSTSDEVYNALEKVRDDKSVKAILVQISSPGGSPTASEEIAEYLKDINKTKPVVMYVDDMAASGAYYIASAIKPLIANKNAIVGSIGVIMPQYNIGELAKKIGIKENTLTAGKFKQPFSFFKDISDENKKYIQDNLLKPTYKNFLEDVAKNRGVGVEKLKEFAEGKIFIANTKEIKGILVDRISNLFTIKSELKKRYGKDLVFEVVNEKFDPKGLFGVELKEILEKIEKESLKLF